MLPPHARGCTGGWGYSAGGRRASPARAGMYPRESLPDLRIPGFPRTRGDVPQPGRRYRISVVLPPHARGCTLPRAQTVRRTSASPARAGMYRAWSRWGTGWRSFPRTRGDVPVTKQRIVRWDVLPPHARGCTCPSKAGLTRRRASPARAGMYPHVVFRLGRGRGFPRTRGDVPAGSIPSGAVPELPPHARGCTGHGCASTAAYRASPARAGMYRTTSYQSKLVFIHYGWFGRGRGRLPTRDA